jgi:hypothetical protein
VGAFTLIRSLYNGEPPAISLMGANIPPVLGQAAREKLQIPATDSVLYLFVAHGRPNTDGLVITSTEMIRADSTGIRRVRWGNLDITLNTKFTKGSGTMVVRDKVTGRVDTIYRGLSTRELSVLGEAVNQLEHTDSAASARPASN